MNSTKKLILAIALTMAFSLNARVVFAEGEPSSRCTKCHEDEAAAFETSHHGKAWAKGANEKRGQVACEACHGSADAHLKSESKDDIISFNKKSKNTADEQSKQCLSCHNKFNDLNFWKTGKHAKNDVSCSTCHQMHKGREFVKPSIETCFRCHKDIQHEFNKASHHPLVEGKVTCWDCHNAHGTPTHYMLRAENNNQLCYKCHADKRGPYMWEHPPVEEDCNICHKPHGSQHYKLLTERPPHLCDNCHSNAHGDSAKLDGNQGPGGIARSAKVFGRGCINCHNHVHGSTAPLVYTGTNKGRYTSGKYFVR